MHEKGKKQNLKIPFYLCNYRTLMKELPELSVNIKFCVRVSGISKEICHLLFFLYIYSHCKQMAFIMHTVFLQNNLIYGNPYHNQS